MRLPIHRQVVVVAAAIVALPLVARSQCPPPETGGYFDSGTGTESWAGPFAHRWEYIPPGGTFYGHTLPFSGGVYVGAFQTSGSYGFASFLARRIGTPGAPYGCNFPTEHFPSADFPNLAWHSLGETTCSYYTAQYAAEAGFVYCDPAPCGNGVKEPWEECDPTDLQGSVPCTPDCRLACVPPTAVELAACREAESIRAQQQRLDECPNGIPELPGTTRSMDATTDVSREAGAVSPFDVLVQFVHPRKTGAAVKLDVRAARAAGVSRAGLKFGKSAIKLQNFAMRKLLSGPFLPPTPVQPPTGPVKKVGELADDAAKALKDWLQELSGVCSEVLPCGNFLCPDECPEHAIADRLFAGKKEAEDYLLASGFHAVPDGPLGGFGGGFAKPVVTACPIAGSYRYQAEAIKCSADENGCWGYWTQGPEPDPEIVPTPSLWQTALWGSYTYWWHKCGC